jgi:hypothetical protein
MAWPIAGTPALALKTPSAGSLKIAAPRVEPLNYVSAPWAAKAGRSERRHKKRSNAGNQPI